MDHIAFVFKERNTGGHGKHYKRREQAQYLDPISNEWGH